MKKFFAVAMAMVLVGGAMVMGLEKTSVGPSYADREEKMDHRLVVNGEGTIEMKPDLAHIWIGVQTENKDANKAQQENARKMEMVQKAIEKQGIQKKDLQTNNYSIYKTVKYNNLKRNDENKEEVYRVQNQLKVTVRDFKKISSLIDEASKAGANEIGNIDFSVENEEIYYQEALQMAMKNAKGKANAILKTLGKTASTPVRIHEASRGGASFSRDAATFAPMAKAESGSHFNTPIEAGRLTLKAAVSVEYDYGK